MVTCIKCSAYKAVKCSGLFILVSLLVVLINCNTENEYMQSKKSLVYLEQKAEKGDMEAAKKLRFHYEYLGEKDKSLYWLRKGAHLGDSEAQMHMYEYFHDSVNVKERGEAISYLFKSANANYALAQRELARLYFKGEGLNRNVMEGEKWLRRASRSSATAMYEYGSYIMEKSHGVNDFPEAYAWFKRASSSTEQGSYIYSEANRKRKIILHKWVASGCTEKELENKAGAIEDSIESSGAEDKINKK